MWQILNITTLEISQIPKLFWNIYMYVCIYIYIFIFIEIYDLLIYLFIFLKYLLIFYSYYFLKYSYLKNKVGLESCIQECGTHMQERLTHVLGGDENHEPGQFNRSLTCESLPRRCYQAASNPIPRCQELLKMIAEENLDNGIKL